MWKNASMLLHLQEPTSYVAQYTAPATLITPSCKIAKNTTDGWTKTLYTAGDPVTYASREAFMAATMNGSATPVFTVTVRLLPRAVCANLASAQALPTFQMLPGTREATVTRAH